VKNVTYFKFILGFKLIQTLKEINIKNIICDALPVQHYTFKIYNTKNMPIYQPSPSESQHTGILFKCLHVEKVANTCNIQDRIHNRN
jgi:hypothetical protein